MDVFQTLDNLPKRNDKRYKKIIKDFESLFKSLEDLKKKRGINTLPKLENDH